MSQSSLQRERWTFAALAALLVLSTCGDPTGPAPEPGEYVLQSVDEQPLPIAVGTSILPKTWLLEARVRLGPGRDATLTWTDSLTHVGFEGVHQHVHQLQYRVRGAGILLDLFEPHTTGLQYAYSDSGSYANDTLWTDTHYPPGGAGLDTAYALLYVKE